MSEPVFTKADILQILEKAGEYAARDILDRLMNAAPELHTDPLLDADGDMAKARADAMARAHDTTPAPAPVEPADL